MKPAALPFCLPVLLVCLLVSNAGASIPPHPDLLERLEKNAIPLPYFLAHAEDIRERGVNSPWTSPALAESIQTGAEKERTVGPLNPPAGVYRALVLLVDFSDKSARTAASTYDNLLFGSSSSSVRSYFRKVSYGTLDIFTVNLPGSMGWRRMLRGYSYYVNGQNGLGSYPRNAQRLVEDAVLAANSRVNFADYDNDHDGFVDALFVVHAGTGAEMTGSNNDIWSHAWCTSTPISLDGVQISRYSMEPEYWQRPGDMTIGVFAHEFGHAGFGLPDLYDTDYTSRGLGYWSLMAYGCWNGSLGDSPSFPDAWSHVNMGYVSATIVVGSLPARVINAVEYIPQVFRLWTAGDGGKEYFLVENRQLLGYDACLPSGGLLIYHVDELVPGNRNEWYPGHTGAGHYRVALEQADGLYGLERTISCGDGGDPYPGSKQNRFFTATSTPASLAYSGRESYVTVGNISVAGLTVTADLRVVPAEAPRIVSHPLSLTVAEGQPATFSVTASGTAPLTYQWQRNGNDIPEAKSASYSITSAALVYNGARFRCVVRNIAGMDTSNSATLTVLPASANLIRNPGFELGTGGWSFYTNGSGSLAAVSPGAVGNKSARVGITAAGTNVQLYQRGMMLEPGKTYRLRFRAYSNTGHDLSVTIQRHTSPYTSYGLSNRVFDLSVRWGMHSATFTTSGFTGTTTDSRLRFWLAPYDAEGDLYFFDDVVLEKITAGEMAKESDAGPPTGYQLWQNFPNPFNSSTAVSFSLPEVSVVSLRVLNILGEAVVVLEEREMAPGNHSASFDGTNLASGVYYCRLEARGVSASASLFVRTINMMMVK